MFALHGLHVDLHGLVARNLSRPSTPLPGVVYIADLYCKRHAQLLLKMKHVVYMCWLNLGLICVPNLTPS